MRLGSRVARARAAAYGPALVLTLCFGLPGAVLGLAVWCVVLFRFHRRHRVWLDLG